ncbi:MAG: efflux RND transporter periplasmic adaptor subunit [Nitrospirota bacterium]
MSDESLSKLRIEKSSLTEQKRKRRKGIYITAAIILILAAGALLAGGVLSPSVDVEVTTVGAIYPSQAFTVLNASGYVVAQRKASVASKVTGRLVSISVEEGNRVKKGEVIARLENNDAMAVKEQAEARLRMAGSDLEQAKAELHDAGIDFKRKKELFKEELISKFEYDASEARYRKAKAATDGAEAAIKANEAALREADVSLEYTVIRAPFDAVVLTKNADIGDIITPLGAAANAKAAVVTIADMDSLQVEVDVSESNLESVKTGQPCEIQLDALPDSRFRGEVHMIVPTADRTKATVMVKIRFLDKDARILPEMSAKAAFLQRRMNPEEMKPVTAIHPDSIVVRKERKAVFLVKGDHAVETRVSTGSQIGDMIEILEGLHAGDRIVARPSTRLRDGSRIKIAEK